MFFQGFACLGAWAGALDDYRLRHEQCVVLEELGVVTTLHVVILN